MVKRKELSIVFLLSIILVVFSLLSIMGIFMREKAVIMGEHDEGLFSLAHSVDRNLILKMDEMNSEMEYILNKDEYISIEESILKSGNYDEAVSYLKKSHLFTKVALEGLIVTEEIEGNGKVDRKTLFTICQSSNDNHSYTFLKDTDGDQLFVCYDEQGKYSIALRHVSLYSNLTYYILLDLDHFYDTIIPPELHKSHWVVFMDPESGLCLQNHENQKPWQVFSYDEIMSRNDGYTMIAMNQINDMTNAQTYLYENYYNKKVHERLITIPNTKTANGILAIGIAKDSEDLYHELHVDLIWMFLITIIIAIFGILIYKFVYDYVNKAQEEKKELERKHEKERLLSELKQAQILNATRQMQPHFIYNALGSIREIVLENPEEGAELIYSFTQFLRACLKSMTSNEMISFEQEINNIDAYINIEKMRLGEKLHIIFDIKENKFLIIPLGIQPLVENAIRHGICKKRGKKGTVIIRSYKNAESFVIEVEDDGIGFDVERTITRIENHEQDSIGIQNLIMRFKEQLDGEVEILSEVGKGTLVRVKIPEKKEIVGDLYASSNC